MQEAFYDDRELYLPLTPATVDEAEEVYARPAEETEEVGGDRCDQLRTLIFRRLSGLVASALRQFTEES